MRRVPVLVLVACVIGAPAVVLAQSAQDKADAEVLFNAGKEALGAGNFAAACPKLAESQKRDPAIGTALYLAECYERSGKIASAWAEFRQAEDMANQRRDNRAAVAKARADKLVPSKLTVVLAAGAEMPGLEVRRDGELIASAQLGLASPTDGGKHVIIATAAGHKAFEWSGEIATDRGAVTVTIPKLDESGAATPIPTVTATATVHIPSATVTTTATVAPTTTASAEGGGGMGGGKIAGLVIGAVGLATIGVGTTLGLVANANYQATSTGPNPCNASGCPTQAGVDAQNSAKTLADVSTGVFIGGCVALVAGVVMFLVIPKPTPSTLSAHVTLAPMFDPRGGGAMLSGRF